MLIGYNTNVPYKGKQYHVQTEDSGIGHPFIITLLYCQGAILRSVKTGYSHIIGRPDFEAELRKIMKQQHREMIKELITGRCDAVKGEGDDKTAQTLGGPEMTKSSDDVKRNAKSLDDILLEHITKKVKP